MTERLHKWFPAPIMTAWLALVWVLLWGSFTWANVVDGLVLGWFVTKVMPLPRIQMHGTVRPVALAWLIVTFLFDVVSAAVVVAQVAFRREPPHPAVIRVQLKSHSEVIMATTAGLVTLIPGSVVIEAHRATGALYLHVFDVRSRKPQRRLAEARSAVLRQEERIMRAFARREDLIAAGYAPTWRMGQMLEESAR